MMKRLILSIAIMIVCMTSFSSCTVHTYATTQDDIYVEAQADIVQSDVDYSVVVRYGTPYYYNGALLYYIYNNLYYYPYMYNRQWYVRAYRKPFNHLQHRPYFRPNKYDRRFTPPQRPRPNVRVPNRPTRPTAPPRNNTNHKFGGRR